MLSTFVTALLTHIHVKQHLDRQGRREVFSEHTSAVSSTG